MATPDPNHAEHRLGVKILLTDGLSDHVIDSKLYLTRTELAAIGGFARLASDLKMQVETYQTEAGG